MAIPAHADVEALFRAVFPGQTYSEDQHPRLAAELRRTADVLHPGSALEQAQNNGNERAASGTAAVDFGSTGSPPPAQHVPKRRRQNGGRPIDFSAYHTRYVALEIMYLGWDHQGFACQADSENTIEGHFFAVLRRLRLVPEDADWHALRYSRCGRTDKGVSALGQVVALLLRSSAKAAAPLPPWQQEHDFAFLLNRGLPETIRVLGWADVPQDFDARFQALYREYKYYLVQDGDRPLDVAAVQQAAGHLVGEHDFRNFCKMDVEKVHTFRRTVFHARVDACPDYGLAGRTVCLFNIRGTAFLWHQVRCLAAVLLMVGRGEENPDVVRALLDVDTSPAKPQYPMAPEEPLLLATCAYPQDIAWHRAPGTQATLRELVRSMLRRQITRICLLATVEERISVDAVNAVADGESNGVSKGRGRGVQHIPLLRRSTEPSMQERLEKLGKTELGSKRL